MYLVTKVEEFSVVWVEGVGVAVANGNCALSACQYSVQRKITFRIFLFGGLDLFKINLKKLNLFHKFSLNQFIDHILF